MVEQLCLTIYFILFLQTPENQTSFVVELTRVSSGAQIDPSRKFATVIMESNDYPNGLVQFATKSRFVQTLFFS